MNHYLLFYETVDNYLEKRQAYRDEHLRLAQQKQAAGDLVMAGAYADPADGAVLVFKGDSEDVAAEFARMDPYVAKGLVKRWWVRKWNVVVE